MHQVSARQIFMSGAALAALLAVSPANAQATAGKDVTIEEIVVTATRQEQALSKVPISIAAYTQESLDAQGVRQIDDIARLTPGLTFTRSTYGTGGLANIVIRGVSSTTGAATTGIYIDDTPIQVREVGFTATNTYPKVFDLARVEVLRGPQGTLFGAGSMGGTVRFISPEADLNKRSGYARAEGSAIKGGGKSGEIGAAFGGPLIEDKLAFRISGWKRHDGGWIDNIDNVTGAMVEEDANSSDSTVFRVALKAQPVENLTISPSFFYQKVTVDDSSIIWENLSDIKDGRFRQGNRLPEWTRDYFTLPALAVSYDFGGVAIESNTSLFRRKSASQWDYTDDIGSIFAGTPYPYTLLPGYQVQATMLNRQKNFTQEVRLRSTNSEARLRWVAGVFYAKQEQSSEQWDYDPQFAQLMLRRYGLPLQVLFGPTVRTDVPHDLINFNTAVDKQLAGFGQIDFEVIDGLTLTAGVRVSKTKFSSTTDQFGMAISETHTTGRQSESPVTPKVGVSWQVDDRNLVYASAAKGFRIGGTNPPLNPVACAPDFRALGITANPLTYKSDSVWNYEAGTKNTLMNGRVQVAASVFRVDWSDIQRPVQLQSCFLGYTTNLGKARSQGFDLTAQAVPVEGLNLSLAVGFTDAKYKQTILATSGAKIVEAGDSFGGGKWVVAASAEYQFAAFGRDAYVRGDYQYRSRPPGQNPNTNSYDPAIMQLPEQHLVKLRTGLRLDNYDVSLFVDNLFNEAPLLARTHGSRTSPLFLVTTYQPRTAGITLIARY